MERTIKLFLLALLVIVSFSNKINAQPKPKKYLNPFVERYYMHDWLNVSCGTFFHLMKYAPSSDLSRFFIYTDKACNDYYWVSYELKLPAASDTFTEKETQLKIILENFEVEFITKYPYMVDTIRPGTKAFEKTDLENQMRLYTGKSPIHKDAHGNFIRIYDITNYGESGIDMLIRSKDNGKLVLLKGTSLRYGELCKLVRKLYLNTDPRTGIIDYLASQGRSIDMTNNSQNVHLLSYLLITLAPEAIEVLPEYIPGTKPVNGKEFEGTGEKSVQYSSQYKN